MAHSLISGRSLFLEASRVGQCLFGCRSLGTGLEVGTQLRRVSRACSQENAEGELEGFKSRSMRARFEDPDYRTKILQFFKSRKKDQTVKFLVVKEAKTAMKVTGIGETVTSLIRRKHFLKNKKKAEENQKVTTPGTGAPKTKEETAENKKEQ